MESSADKPTDPRVTIAVPPLQILHCFLPCNTYAQPKGGLRVSQFQGKSQAEKAELHRTAAVFLYGSDRLLNDEVDRFVALLVFAVDIVLAGHDGVQDDADDGADGQTREADRAEMERACRGVADADGQNQDEGRDQNIAGLGEVDLVLDDVAHADCGDHAVEHEADAADGAAGHGGDDGRELRAEGEEHGQNCRDADDARVIDAAEGQNAGVFAVGRVGGAPKRAASVVARPSPIRVRCRPGFSM